MEIQGSDESKTQLKPYSTTLFGRGNGFHPNDLAVSRRHISFELNSSPDSQTGPRVSFEVLGKNPLWVYCKNEDGKIRAFKRFQRGELGVGDMFCLSAKAPVWFTVKKVETEVVDERESERGEIEGRVNDELSRNLEVSNGVKGNGDFGFDSVDVSAIDPVQEFGFLVIRHEFDQYPKKMIRDVKNWDWFLEDPRGEDSDEEEAAEKRGRSGTRVKRKKTKGDNDADEEWTGESEDDVTTTNARKVQRSTYQTRAKDRSEPSMNRKDRKFAAKTSRKEEEEEEEFEEDEDDETLGGFIVEDDTVEEEDDDEEEEEEDEGEEEEEFVEGEDELED